MALNIEKLAADFNASQQEFRIVPTYKGNYTETVTASIFAGAFIGLSPNKYGCQEPQPRSKQPKQPAR